MADIAPQEPHKQESERHEQHDVEQQLHHRRYSAGGDVLNEFKRVELRRKMVCGAIPVRFVRHRVLREGEQTDHVQHAQIRADGRGEPQTVLVMVEQRQNRQGQER